MTKEEILKEFAALSPEDQEAVRAELIEGAPSGKGGEAGGPMGMMQQMMQKMMGSGNPVEMMQKMMEH